MKLWHLYQNEWAYRFVYEYDNNKTKELMCMKSGNHFGYNEDDIHPKEVDLVWDDSKICSFNKLDNAQRKNLLQRIFYIFDEDYV